MRDSEEARRAARLSQRELEILRLLAEGKNIKQISDELMIDDDDEGTIRTHLMRVREKILVLIHLQTKRVHRIERDRALRGQRARAPEDN
jgi:DNA-binding CsgD family transcriptional regulator